MLIDTLRKLLFQQEVVSTHPRDFEPQTTKDFYLNGKVHNVYHADGTKESFAYSDKNNNIVTHITYELNGDIRTRHYNDKQLMIYDQLKTVEAEVATIYSYDDRNRLKTETHFIDNRISNNISYEYEIYNPERISRIENDVEGDISYTYSGDNILINTEESATTIIKSGTLHGVWNNNIREAFCKLGIIKFGWYVGANWYVCTSKRTIYKDSSKPIEEVIEIEGCIQGNGYEYYGDSKGFKLTIFQGATGIVKYICTESDILYYKYYSNKNLKRILKGPSSCKCDIFDNF